MKSKGFPSLFLASVLAVFANSPRASAQGDTVTIGSDEFQRMVYSGHVLAQMDGSPELDASLQVLLEFHRRNPRADPTALADLCREALQRYRTNAPACIRNSGRRDEILAAYLDAFRQIPARTNFNHATLGLIHSLVARLNAPDTMQHSDLLNAGFERLLNAELELPERQSLVGASVNRAADYSEFREAMDRLFVPAIGVSLTNRPAEIIHATPALSNNPTMRALLRFSETNATGGVRVSVSELKDLFAAEVQALQETVATNIAVDLEISRRQFDFLTYLAGPHENDLQFEAGVQQLQAQKIAASHASFNVLSRLADAEGSRLGSDMQVVGDSLASVAKGIGMLVQAGGLNKIGGYASLISAGLGIIGLFDTGPSPDEAILEGIDDIRNMIRDFSAHADYRFDRVDQTLVEIYTNLNAHLDRIDVQLGQIEGNVTEMREDLVVTQNDLHRLERNFHDYLNAGFRRDLVLVVNGALGYEAIHGMPMDLATFNQIPDGPENTFYTWAYSNAKDPLSSPANFAPADLTDDALLTQLNARPLESSLNYLNQFLSTRFGLPSLSLDTLANPRDWFVGAQAYLQLSVENPLHYRRISTNRLGNIIASGRQLESFFQKVLFTGTGANLQVNTNLFDALLGYYAIKLNTLTNEVRTREQAYALAHGFPDYEIWRQWDLSLPRHFVSSTDLRRVPLNPDRVTRVAAGSQHALALRQDGSVMGWGNNDHGQTTIPIDATNVMAIAASHDVSMILKSNGTVVVFGINTYGATNVPAGLSNVVAIATSGIHCLAAKADGTVLAWGYVTNVPAGLTNVVAVAASDEQRDSTGSLALKADGTIAAWGSFSSSMPAGLSNVVAIAAGDEHYLALKSDGRVVAWGYGETNVPATLSNVVAIAAGEHGSLALQADGKIGWGMVGGAPPDLTSVAAIAMGGGEGLGVLDDGTVVNLPRTSRTAPLPPDLTDAVAIAAGADHNLALRNDGTVMGWGAGSFVAAPDDQVNRGQALIPAHATNVAAIAAGEAHSLALKRDGTLLAWGDNYWGQTNCPASATAVVAIAAGRWHNLALRADGTVVGWGYNYSGQATGVRNTVYPYISAGVVTVVGQTLTNVVAVAAGESHSLALRADGTVIGWGSSLGPVPPGLNHVVAIAASSWNHRIALRADGTVVAWGSNQDGQTNCPPGATNVVAIAAGWNHCLALRADGTVVGWGNNDFGQATGAIHGAPGIVVTGGEPLTNVLAIAAGRDSSCFLQAGRSDTSGSFRNLAITQRQLPVRVALQLSGLSEDVLAELNLDLHAFGVDELSAAKALLRAVLDLGMPYTMERDDVLHGFLYGSESLADSDIVRALLIAEIDRLRTEPSAPPSILRQVAPTRFARFSNRLETRLNDAAQTGQPEIPRLVGHTLRLLNLLRDAWNLVPPPALEIGREGDAVGVILHGEPYTHYTLQYRDNLTVPVWATSITNMYNGSIILLPASAPQRFYRSMLQVP